jgi:two-component system C4-dicarboxylate transport response regulator DctD
MLHVFDCLKKAAAAGTDILLVGESGTGKELAAKAIYSIGPRRHQRFIAQNCGSIQPLLVGSELFGHEPGAFTDAPARKIGLFEHASPGTVFLDEINLLPMAAQGALLRVLEERMV